MAPTLYYIYGSPPVRAVLMTGEALGVTFNLQEVDLLAGEHKTPQFLKLNPQHTVPTLVDDDGFVIWDSHAIMPYLLSKYGKNDALYPSDIKKRALVDQRLHFENGNVFSLLLKILRPIIYKGKKTIDQEDIEAMHEIYGLVEEFLNGRQWIAGDSVTIADYSLISSITSANVMIPIDAKKYPKVTAWLKRSESLPEYEKNRIGLESFEKAIKSYLS